jgi:hypothetical protein
MNALAHDPLLILDRAQSNGRAQGETRSIRRGQISFMTAPVTAPETAAVIPIAQTPCSRHVVNGVYIATIIRKIAA